MKHEVKNKIKTSTHYPLVSFSAAFNGIVYIPVQPYNIQNYVNYNLL